MGAPSVVYNKRGTQITERGRLSSFSLNHEQHSEKRETYILLYPPKAKANLGVYGKKLLLLTGSYLVRCNNVSGEI